MAEQKPLTALEDLAVRRLGSTTAEPLDVWIISAKRTLALRTSSFVSARHLLRGRSVIVVTIVTVIELGARRDPQVGGSGTAGTVREEVETPAVEGQSRACLVTCGIDIDERPQVRRGR